MSTERLPDNTLVELVKLVAKPENNGRQGHIKTFLADVQKYEVILMSGNIVKVKAENLAIVPKKEKSTQLEIRRSRSRGKGRNGVAASAKDGCTPDNARLVLGSLLLNNSQSWKLWLKELRTSKFQGSHALPRGAGIICFRAQGRTFNLDSFRTHAWDRHDLHVCLVERAPMWQCASCNDYMWDTWEQCSGCQKGRPSTLPRFHCSEGPGRIDFPQGGMEAVDGGCIMANAFREWEQETGITGEKLYILNNKHLDDDTGGARMLLGVFLPGGESISDWISPEAGLQCREEHWLKLACMSTTCNRCRGSKSSKGAFLFCPICDYKVCSWCQDPDPCLYVQWVPIDEAEKQLSNDKAALLEEAAAAVLRVQHEIQSEPVEPQEKAPAALELAPGELETFALRYPVNGETWTRLLTSPSDVIVRVVRGFSLKRPPGMGDYSSAVTSWIREIIKSKHD